jgi:hypothetical protein
MLCERFAQINQPWHLLQLWKPEIWEQRRCLALHDKIMDDKVRQVMAHPPPDYTIAGGWQREIKSLFVVCLIIHAKHVLKPPSGCVDRLSAPVAVLTDYLLQCCCLSPSTDGSNGAEGTCQRLMPAGRYLTLFCPLIVVYATAVAAGGNGGLQHISWL